MFGFSELEITPAFDCTNKIEVLFENFGLESSGPGYVTPLVRSYVDVAQKVAIKLKMGLDAGAPLKSSRYLSKFRCSSKQSGAFSRAQASSQTRS